VVELFAIGHADPGLRVQVRDQKLLLELEHVVDEDHEIGLARRADAKDFQLRPQNLPCAGD